MHHGTTMRHLYDLISAGDVDGFGEHVSAAVPDLRLEAEDVLASGDQPLEESR